VLLALVWLGVERALVSGLALSCGAACLVAGRLLEKGLGGRRLSHLRWWVLCGGIGAGIGLSTPLLALSLMAIKTGLHGHGPEMSPAELHWIWSQTPWWAVAGSLAGLGVCLLAQGWCARDHDSG
jgi:hypothetical protein